MSVPLRLRGLKPSRYASVFETLVNAIACQQLSLEVGIHLLDRVVASYGPPAPQSEGLYAFPTAHHLAEVEPAQLRKLGFRMRKARTIVTVAQAVAAGTLDLNGLAAHDRQTVAERLTAVNGVGRWTTEYLLLRGLGRLDAFPVDDVGARNTLARVLQIDERLDAAAARDIVMRWHPCAGMVYFYMLLDSLFEAGVVSPTRG